MHSRDLLLYCKSWQWRYINLHANLQKNTLDTWKEYSAKKLQDGKPHMSRWKWAGTVVKRENVQKMDPKFWVLSTAQFVVSPQRHTHFYKNMWFYEHGFRKNWGKIAMFIFRLFP